MADCTNLQCVDVEKANPVSLQANVIKEVKTSAPALLTPVGLQTAPIDVVALELESAAATSNNAFRLGWGAFLPRAGVWKLLSTANVLLQFNKITPDAALFFVKLFEGYSQPAHTQVTAGAAAVVALAANHMRKIAVVQNTGLGNVRAKWDGVAPTPTTGHQLLPGGSLNFIGSALARNQIQVIRETIDCLVDVTQGL